MNNSEDSSKSDAELVADVLSGNDQAFEELVLRYSKLAVSIAYGMTRDYSHSQDLAQNAFLRAYQSLHTLRDPEKFRSWFYGLVRRTCIYWLRKQKKEHSLDEIDTDGAIFEKEGTRTPLVQLSDRERRAEIRAAVTALPEKYREVILLFHFHSKSYDEIGDILGLSYAGVDSRLLRARIVIKEKLKEWRI